MPLGAGDDLALPPRAGPRLNLPLVVGGLLVALLFVVAILGPHWAPHDPLKHYPILRDESGEWHTHPFAPLEMPGFLLGTDYDRRDILSRLLWAVRPTLLIALLAGAIRITAGTCLGLAGGWLGGRVGGAVSGLTTVATTMPLLIVALMLLYVAGRERTVWQFVLALSLTGWAATAQLVYVRARGLRHEGYMEAARAIGAGDVYILRRHVLPQLRALLPVVVSFDIAAVLLALAELGFIGFFIGSGTFRSAPRGEDAGFILKLVPGQPELSQMLSVGWDNIFLTPWLSIWAGSAFLLAILGFTLAGEGLKREFGGLRR